MASSNRHWPSMFKSKPHQWQHDINSSLLSSASHRSSSFSSGCEVERSPEAKPRWNPKPEQIWILEAIFNSGMVNPPREEIRRIRVQLQEYGQVGDANVFYWFQNRKSRSKHKLRLLHKHSISQPQPQTLSSANSTSSEKPRKNKNNNKNISLDGIFPSEAAFLFPVSTVGRSESITFSSQLGQYLSVDMIEQQKPAPTVETSTGLLLSEILNGNVSYREIKTLQQPQPQICYSTNYNHQTTSYYNNIMFPVPPITSVSLATVPSTSDKLQFQGTGERIRVFINEMELEVSSGPFNVRNAFGQEVVLINSAGQPIVTDEYGVALQPLQHGASYYLI